MSDDFGDFQDLLANMPASKPLPSQLLMLGQDGEEMRPFLVDEDQRLILNEATSRYYARLPVKVPTTAGILEAAPDSGERNVVEINVVNVTSSAVELTLYLDEEEATDAKIFAANKESIPAYGRFQWQGCILLEVEHIWGKAGAADALYALFTVRDELSAFRR